MCCCCPLLNLRHNKSFSIKAAAPLNIQPHQHFHCLEGWQVRRSAINSSPPPPAETNSNSRCEFNPFRAASLPTPVLATDWSTDPQPKQQLLCCSTQQQHGCWVVGTHT